LFAKLEVFTINLQGKKERIRGWGGRGGSKEGRDR